MPETQYVDTSRVRIAYETFGDPSAPPVMLVTGLAAQMLAWPDELCVGLAELGFYVVRADNRDVGLSSHFPTDKPLTLLDVLRKRAPYTIADMADDMIGLIDALGLAPVHLIGVSMGGFISQTVAIKRPDMIKTLTLLMTSTGSRRVGLPKPRVVWRILSQPPAAGREAAIATSLITFRAIGSTGYPFNGELISSIVAASYDRDYDAPGRRRQLAAVVAQPDRTKQLAQLKIPTLVMHGLVDPVVSASGGVALARTIPGARFVGFSGMGHDLPRALWPRVLAEIAELCHQSTQESKESQPAT
jgi:pimeloyl-ACP methyl ester carboxylesterase